MRKKTSTIMAWLLAASVTVTSLSAGTVTAYAQEGNAAGGSRNRDRECGRVWRQQ